MSRRHPDLLSALSLLMCCATSAWAQSDSPFLQIPFQLNSSLEDIVFVDTNGDSLKDLIATDREKTTIYFQSPEGFNFDNDYAELSFPGQAVGWDISTAYASPTGGASIIALIDGREVLLWHVVGQSLAEPIRLHSGLRGFLGTGIQRLHFSRDLNSDGHDDLIVPGAGVLNIYISTADGYQPALQIESDRLVQTVLYSTNLERRTGQAIYIPLMELRDVNNDGNPDLISRTDESLDVFLADSDASRYFPASASYSIDIAEIEQRLGEFDIDNLDFSNLTGVLALTHEEILVDADGDGIEDLLLREGGKVSLFGGTATGMDLEQPRQVLRSGGNVLSTFLYDENEDGLKDLWLWRVEPISVGDLFVWLALSGSVAVEAFIYPNEGQRFARRPTRQITVDLRFPSVIRLATSVQEISNEMRESSDETYVPTAQLNVAGSDNELDLAVLVQDQVQIFIDSLEATEESSAFLGSLNYSRERDNYEIDIRDIIDSIAVNENPAWQRVQERTPEQRISLAGEVSLGELIVAQLNDDQRDDLIVFTGMDSSYIEGILLLSKAHTPNP